MLSAHVDVIETFYIFHVKFALNDDVCNKQVPSKSTKHNGIESASRVVVKTEQTKTREYQDRNPTKTFRVRDQDLLRQ